MLNRLPKWLPTLEELLPDLGRPSAKALAKTFGVTERTVKNWIKNGAPRSVIFSLFWLTSYGRQHIDAEAHEYTVMHIGLADARKRQVIELEKKIQRLSAIADFGAANDPAPDIVSGIKSDLVVPLTPDPGLRPTMPPPSCEPRRWS